MSDMKQTENVKAKGTIRGLKLNRETLRELDAGELKQAQGQGKTHTGTCEYTDLFGCKQRTRGCR